MAVYNWQQNDWTRFSYSLHGMADLLYAFAENSGRLSGSLHAMPAQEQLQITIDNMVAEALKSSEIEGEFLNRQDIFSSIQKNLGLITKMPAIKDKKAKGIGELMVDARKTFDLPLTEEKILQWHTMLLHSDKEFIAVGKWRTHKEPMQVISGAIGKQKIHFEAPPYKDVPKEMKRFIRWFNNTMPGGKEEIKQAPVRSALVHLYFESIHPLEDGNGRIGRVLAEKALYQTAGTLLVLSLSSTIELNKKEYYQQLEKASKSNKVTKWVHYFIKLVVDAQKHARAEIDFTLKKTAFYNKYKEQLNERHALVIKKMLAEGSAGFKGGMNARKYTGITKTSKATATRDLQYLAEKNIFISTGKGRSSSYEINL